MVSFQCDACADTVKKPKLDQHRSRCHASFTCLDCSTTFRGQEYKGHTSCISEAEKYQGALYKGAKKGNNQPNGSAPQPTAPATIIPPSDPGPTSAVTSTIHPSRLQAIESAPLNDYSSGSSGPGRGRGRGRGGPGSSGFGGGGRGGYGYRGRGSYGASSSGSAHGAGDGSDYVKFAATAQNRVTAAGGMRSWGSTPVNGTPVPDDVAGASASEPKSAGNGKEQAAPTAIAGAITNGTGGDDAEKKKKKKKKGDKGGTGSKANSSTKNRKTESELAAEAAQSGSPSVSAPAATSAPTPVTTSTTPNGDEPKLKKRKRDPSPSAPSGPSAPAPGEGVIPSAGSASAGVSEKTLKRLRKNLSKLEPTPSSTSASASASSADSIPLSTWLEKVAQAKGKTEGLSTDDVLSGLRVVHEGGKWVISA